MTTHETLNPAFASELHRHLYETVGVLELCDRSFVNRREVTVAQGHTLLALPARGAMSMNELSTAMNLAGSTMTRVVDQLVYKGLAGRAPDEEDRRIVRVTLTERGREVRGEVETDFLTVFAQVAAQIDEKDWQPFVRVLHAVTRTLTAQCCCRPGAE
ncbi:MAG: MarR family transcriptional regulator [Thermoleophilia bacterium]